MKIFYDKDADLLQARRRLTAEHPIEKAGANCVR